MSLSILKSAPVRQYAAAARALLVLTVVVGLAYPLAMTGLAQVAFHTNANGSLLHRDGKVVGSALIGQAFGADPRYFQSRPSAAGKGYDPTASGASNLGPQSPDLIDQIRQRRTAAASPGSAASRPPRSSAWSRATPAVVTSASSASRSSTCSSSTSPWTAQRPPADEPARPAEQPGWTLVPVKGGPG